MKNMWRLMLVKINKRREVNRRNAETFYDIFTNFTLKSAVQVYRKF